MSACCSARHAEEAAAESESDEGADAAADAGDHGEHQPVSLSSDQAKEVLEALLAFGDDPLGGGGGDGGS